MSDVATGGGASIGREVSTGGGNFAGRDDRPLSINVNTAEWRENVATQLLIQDQRISDLEMTDRIRRQHERMTTYEKLVLIGFILLVASFYYLATEMKNLREQLASDKTEQIQKYRP